MNNTVYYESAASDDVRREHLYDGQLFVFAPRRSILNFVDFARSIVLSAGPVAGKPVVSREQQAN